MKSPQDFKEIFDRDIARHEVTIVRANGNDRHIKCGRPGYSSQSFQIVTFPGYLVYVGDMGSFTFWRADDMFGFFRNPEGNVNPRYWSEKLEAVDLCVGYKQFNIELFRENVKDWVGEQLGLEEDTELPEDVLEELEPILQTEDEYECVTAWRDFESERFDFSDFWEVDNREYTSRFLWCCHAIVWAINRFDAMTAEKGGA
jgi:hypothetical protein